MDLSYELINTQYKRRYYKFNQKLSKGSRGDITSYKNFEDPSIPTSTEYFAVSDANDHVERLVFPIWFIDGCGVEDLGKGKPCLRKGDYCEGNMTMLIHGGDITTIRPDEEYLDELIRLNS